MGKEVLRSVRSILDQSGFDRSEPIGRSYDLVARRGSTLLIVRAVMEKDAMDRSSVTDLKKLASVLRASPLIVTGPDTRFHDGVLYLKFGIPLVTVKTLQDHLLSSMPPMVFSGPNGHYVSIDSDALRRVREEKGLSLGALSDMVGVSRRAIQMYESGMGVDLEIAIRLERSVNTALIQPLDPFSYSDKLVQIREMFDSIEGLKRDVFQHLDSLGLEVIPTIACPFDAIAKDRGDVYLTSVEADSRALNERGMVLSELSRVTGERAVMIVGGSVQKKKVGRTAIVGISEVLGADDADELVKLIDKRKG